MLKIGNKLPTIEHQVTKADIQNYAEASGDFNPIHVDEEFAAKSPFGGVIAHGFLTLGHISILMADQFGEGWLTHGEIKVRFRSPVRPGDIVTTGGQVLDVLEEAGHKTIVCEIACTNQKGDQILAGEVRARVGG